MVTLQKVEIRKYQDVNMKIQAHVNWPGTKNCPKGKIKHVINGSTNDCKRRRFRLVRRDYSKLRQGQILHANL